jgi:hypothetical protein
MGDVIDGAMQQAPQPARQDTEDEVDFTATAGKSGAV